MTLAEGLQLLNLLVLPAMYYVIRLEKRIFALELRIQFYLETHFVKGLQDGKETQN